MEKLRALWPKYKEVVSYLFFGVLATLLNLVLYALFQQMFGYEAANGWANVLNNVLCILFAYGTNRTWVFASKSHGRAAWQEFGKFVTCRLGTLVIDVCIMYVGGNWIGPMLVPAQWLKLWGGCVKIGSNVVVVVLNYVFSKLLIFKK